MELLKNPLTRSIRRYRKRKAYKKIDGGRNNMKIIKFGGSPKISWKIKLVPKLKVLSPLKIWTKIKNVYVNKMLSLAGDASFMDSGNQLTGKRIPKARQIKAAYTTTEFDNRLIAEIYKTLVASREMATN